MSFNTTIQPIGEYSIKPISKSIGPTLFVSLKIDNIYGMRYYYTTVSKTNPVTNENSFRAESFENIEDAKRDKEKIINVLHSSGITVVDINPE